MAGRDAPVVEGEDDDDHEEYHQHEGGQAATAPVGPEAHHEAELGCTGGPHQRHLQARALARVAEVRWDAAPGQRRGAG